MTKHTRNYAVKKLQHPQTLQPPFIKLDMNIEALDCLDKSLNINPDNVDAYFLKGVALSELKSYDDALKCFDKSLKLDPDNEKVKMVRQELLSKIN